MSDRKCGTCRYDQLGTKHCIGRCEFSNWTPVKRMMTKEDEALSTWMSAALSDPSVCSEMQESVRNWLESFEHAVYQFCSGTAGSPVIEGCEYFQEACTCNKAGACEHQVPF